MIHKNIENDENTVKIGIKPLMSYVTALKIQLDRYDEVVVFARGKFISKAFDSIEVCKKIFMKTTNIIYADIKVSSQLYKPEYSKKEIYVSSVEIKLTKGEKI